MTDAHLLWHPVASAQDVPFRHAFQGQLLGRELVAWRADDGFVNVWENRCLHRGVRLSIGINDGRELKCQYHGWRYANRTGGCTYIPAHPADAPARTICNRTFPAVERYGLIWSGEACVGEPPGVAALDSAGSFGLRSLPANAPSDLVLESLTGHRFVPNGHAPDRVDEAGMSTEPVGPLGIALRSSLGNDATTVVFFVQPVDSDRCVIRPVMAGRPEKDDETDVLRHHNRRLAMLRDTVEAEAQLRPAPEPMAVAIERLPIHLAELPEPVTGREAPLRVRVARKWAAAEGIAGFELVSMGEQLPTFQPGAHIDVHLPAGLVRQYSVTNGPGELAWYRIGVKREPESRGGSAALHDEVREGDVLAISEPRNNFPLRRDAVRTVLVAGGIGVTPLLAMAQAIDHEGLACELHYFAQTEAHLAFPDVLERLGPVVIPHLGLTPDETGEELAAILTAPGRANHLYVCGPGPMLDATRRSASDHGWPDDAVHFEYFKNTGEIDASSSFEIDLARSAMTLPVEPGQTVLDVLVANGVAVPSSCQQGACGTCSVGVLAGEPDHQDVYLRDVERERGDRMMVCVSRARSDRLVLDI